MPVTLARIAIMVLAQAYPTVRKSRRFRREMSHLVRVAIDKQQILTIFIEWNTDKGKHATNSF